MKVKSKVAVIGAGSWGTALAILLSQKGQEVFLWGKEVDQIQQMNSTRQNAQYLPGRHFPPTLYAFSEMEKCIEGSGVVVMAVPSHAYREVYKQAYPLLAEKTVVVSVVKGIETTTLKTMTQVMVEESLGKELYFSVLSGPSFAEEVAAGQPTAVTVASKESVVAREIQHLFSSQFFRVYTSSDTLGLEICGAMKNVIAIASGICDGLGYGLNTRAALITRGLAEMTRLGLAMDAEPATFAGLGGLGDLVLTCTGNLSRNRSVGLKLGSGQTLHDILAEMIMVAEGVNTTLSCFLLAQKKKVEMPILEQMYAVLYQNKRCEDAVRTLFQRDLKAENTFS